MKKTHYFIFLFISLLCLAGCHYATELPSMVMDEGKNVDSTKIVPPRTYALNSNFLVTCDTLWLRVLPFTDSLAVVKGNELVVAEFSVHPQDSVDSIWVKVARDQETIGWVRENDLLANIVPVDPISQCIHWFSTSHAIPFVVIVAVFFLWFFYRAYRKEQIRLIWLNDIESVFPICLTWLLVTAAMLYNGMQHFVPETWERFYYDPSLSPFDLPGILAAFTIILWLIVLFGIALLDDVFHLAKAETAVFYLMGLASFCILIYVLFTFVWIYIVFVMWAIYTFWALMRLRRMRRYAYRCGVCGKRIKHKGVCPHCGALNE